VTGLQQVAQASEDSRREKLHIGKERLPALSQYVPTDVLSNNEIHRPNYNITKKFAQ